jgi:DNA polymerase alpha subunit A
MYGCLGYSHSRFFAQPIAALVTAKGRETLQKTVDIAQSQLGLDVIYGDTDSIMINTRITDKNAIKTVRELGEQVKREVNKLYRTLELEIDGIFQSMLLLKKKKYAAITVEEGANGELKYQREEKGLDLVRRDWCIQSKDSGRYILDNILSSQDKEETVSNIFTHLDELAKKMRSGEIPLEKYVITKGLSKHPNDYPDGKSQPHVHVAKMMIKNNHRLTVGDHIPYVITEPLGEEDPNRKVSKSSAERARHPDEIARSNGILKPDVEWYLTQQILPPVSRLCEPIEGISQGLLAERLGLDSKRYSQQNSGGGEINDDELVDYTPASCMTDADRFKDVKKLCLMCSACGVESEFPGVLRPLKEDGKDIGIVTGGLQCVNPQCTHPKYWGEASYFDCMSRIMNATSVLINGQIQDYYRGTIKCDDPLCALETRQLSVVGGVCLRRGCNGQMHSKFNERSLHTQLKYLECLFDRHHACEQLERKNLYGTKSDLLKSIPKADQAVYDELHQNARKFVEGSAFNWISPSFWQSMFGDIRAKQ